MHRDHILTRVRQYVNTPGGAHVSMWISFFVFWSGTAAFLPYISVYYESVGLRGAQIGQLNSIPSFIALFSSIIFGFLSDVFRRHKLILAVCTLGMIAVLFVFPIASTFLALLPIVLIYSILIAPCIPLMDQTTLSSLENPANYGKVRAGGSIGWGIMVLATGFLIDQLDLGMPVIFYINIAFYTLFLVLIIFQPSPRRKPADEQGRASLSKILELFRQRGFIMFLLVTIIWAMGEASIGGFLFLHIKHLGGSSTLMGMALSVSLIGEILIFSSADKIQTRFGPQKMVLAAFVIMFLWLTGLSLIRNPSAIPLFQIFGGAGFALLQSGSVAYVNAHAPSEIGTTAQAIRSGLFAGFGTGTGAIISGLIYQNAGSVALFRSMSVVILGGFIVGILAYLTEKDTRSYSRE